MVDRDWRETWELTIDVAAALIALGVENGDTVAIMATNRTAHGRRLGAMAAAATPMSIYNTLSPEQVAFIAAESRPEVVIVETQDHLHRWAQALAEVVGPPRRDDRRRRRHRRRAACDRGRTSSPTARHRARSSERHAPLDPDAAGDDPLHVRHDRQPQGRGAHPPQRACTRRSSTLEAAGLERAQRPAQLPPARPHRRAGPGLYGPQVVGSHCYAIGDPAEPARHPRRGAPDGVLRRPARVGEDQDRHLGQARRRPQPGQREAGRGLDGGRARVGAGAGGRGRDDARDRGGVQAGGRGDSRLPQAAPRPRPGHLGRLAPPRRCRSRSPSSWPASGSRCTTSTA